MATQHVTARVAAYLLTLLLSACGGGGTAEPDTPDAMPLCAQPYEWTGGIAYSLSGGNLAVSWLGADRMYRVVIGPNGYNDLPNIVSVSTSPCLGDPETVAWNIISTGTADWLPPIIVQASVGDGGRMIYTGGNHGSSGSSSGERTAINARFGTLVDGQTLQDGARGFAPSATVLIANNLMAFNTITEGRYAVRQVFRLNITPGLVEVGTQVKALEDVDVLADNGVQMATNGHQESVSFHGDTVSNHPVTAGLTSGPSATNPVWAAEFHSAANGSRVSWMDRTAGVGDGSFVAESLPFIKISNNTSLKSYHAVVAGTRLPLRAGEDYRWRGGYAWQPPDESWIRR